MLLFFDTNVILDIMDGTRPRAKASMKVFELCEIGFLPVAASVLSMVNIRYIMRKKLDVEKFWQAYDYLKKAITFEDLKQSDLDASRKLDFRDSEDAVQAATASRLGAGYIITWDKRDFKNSEVTAVTPEEFLREIVVGEV